MMGKEGELEEAGISMSTLRRSKYSLSLAPSL